jgi:intracellular sulfur oxidation DsrE/DsrF family protein
MKYLQILCGHLFLMMLLFNPLAAVASDNNTKIPDELPELEQVNEIINADEAPPGIVFVIYEYDESALIWIMPRLLHYVTLIHQRSPDLSVAVVSHGDEMLSLTRGGATVYPKIHFDLKVMVTKFDVLFHVCGSFAKLNDIAESDFPDVIDVVPFGPAQIADYKLLDYQVIDVELSD